MQVRPQNPGEAIGSPVAGVMGVVSHLMRVLKTELRSSARAVRALNH